MLQQILLKWSSQGGWNWWACTTHWRDKKCIQNFDWKTWRAETA